MSSISAISGASSAWSDLGSAYPALEDRLFVKVDSNSDGNVDARELQNMLDHFPEKPRPVKPNASDLLAQPSSTADFAQRAGSAPPERAAGESKTLLKDLVQASAAPTPAGEAGLSAVA